MPNTAIRLGKLNELIISHVHKAPLKLPDGVLIEPVYHMTHSIYLEIYL